MDSVFKPRFVSKYCGTQGCGYKIDKDTCCNQPACHKVEEVIFDDDPLQIRHPLTNYICSEHFSRLMGCYR